MRSRSIPLGGLLIAWVAVTALIALNRGIDLLWGVTWLIAVAALIATVLPKVQVRGISVRRQSFPSSAVVGQPQTIAYEVTARGGWPRYGIEILDRLNGEPAPAPTAFLGRVQGIGSYTLSWTPRMRGCWLLGDLAIESRYPLGVMRARRAVDAELREITVYPDFVQLHWLPIQNDAHPRFEQLLSPRRGGHDEFFGIKPYAPGDEPRAIHWRTSARVGELAVKEYEHQQDRQVWIVLDLAESAHVGDGSASTCEQMIRIAHSVAVTAHERAIAVGLVYRIADAIHGLDAGADRATYLQIRDVLARANTHAQLPLSKWARRYIDQLPRGGTWIVFNLGDGGDRAALDRIARARAATPLFVEFDKPTFLEDAPAAHARIRTHKSSQGIVSTIPRGADLTELFRP